MKHQLTGIIARADEWGFYEDETDIGLDTGTDTGTGMGLGLGVFEVMLFGGALLFIVLVAAVMVYSIAKNYHHLKKRGVDPITAQSELAVRALDSQMLAPNATLEDRLAELDRLYAAGAITAEERATARARILSQP